MKSLHCRSRLGLFSVLPLVMASLILGSTEVTGFRPGGYLDSLSPPGTPRALTSPADSAESMHETPPVEHYAHDQPGAGWAGYKHPAYGGYLDHLNQPVAAEEASETPSADAVVGTCVLEAGKKADYGDDIRWGAQVYLDNLSTN